MPFFKNVFRPKDAARTASKAGKYANIENDALAPLKPRWDDAWTRSHVAPEEIQDLVHVCTREMKSRDMPFMLLPFRLTSDTSASRNFVRSFFKAAFDGSTQYQGEGLAQELRLTEPLTLCSILKWCWSRLPGGVVTWDAYELFRTGESDSNFARHAFDTFIPISVESEARTRIIFDFFDLLSAVAARGKSNGMGGRKLSRLAGWWAFDFTEDGKGFEGGYRTWEKAADAASHLFFAYLRSLLPDLNVIGGISALPRSLEALLSQTEYPPQPPLLMHSQTTKVVMIVDSVSPTPFALLRRARHFEYRDDDAALQHFSAYEDTVKALTDECRRVLECIAAANQSVVSSETKDPDPSWSRFEDFGFSPMIDTASGGTNGTSFNNTSREFPVMQSAAQSKNTDYGRPTTPSWADFLSSGFADEMNQTSPTALVLPAQKLPLLGETVRVQSSQSHMRGGPEEEENLEPGELASITRFDLDETFWWVWMISLANEETADRKAAFGRCTLIETRIPGTKWLVMEEQVKGASPGPETGAYIAEKKPKFSLRGRLGRRKSTGKKQTLSPKDPYRQAGSKTPISKTSIGPDQHARIQAAAAQLAHRERAQKEKAQKEAEQVAHRRARADDAASAKTNSVLTLQPHLLSAAGPAMKWDKKFGEAAIDRDTVRAKYLDDIGAGKGSRSDLRTAADGRASPLSPELLTRDLPALPESGTTSPDMRGAASPSPTRIITPPPTTTRPATRVPWPEDSPTDGPDRVPKGNSFPPAETVGEHPALRKPVPERKPVPTPQPNARASEEQARVSDNKSPPNKLRKKEGTGFRKLFGRKKADTSVPALVDPVHTEDYDDDARMQASDAVRSTSRLDNGITPSRGPSPAYSAGKSPVLLESSPKPERSPIASLSEHSKPNVLDVKDGTTQDQQEVNAPFSHFDHGPMQDMPAFVPEDSDDDKTCVTHSQPHQAPSPSVEQVDLDSPAPQTSQPRDDASEASVELHRTVSPSQDRWAQIRKNAADRAARLSEDQSRRSRSQSQSQRTDEGETSGEETIESRVARIKARVAELTGNIDGQVPRDNAGRVH